MTLLLANTTAHVFRTHPGVVTNRVAIKANLVLAVLEEVVPSITTATRGRLAIVLNADLVFTETQETRNMGHYIHTQVAKSVEDVRISRDFATARREDSAVLGETMLNRRIGQLVWRVVNGDEQEAT